MKKEIINLSLTFLGTVAAGLAILLVYDYIRDRKALNAAAQVG